MTIWDPNREPKRSNISVNDLFRALKFFFQTNDTLTGVDFVIEDSDKDFRTTNVSVLADMLLGTKVEPGEWYLWFDLPQIVRSPGAKLGSDPIAVKIYKRHLRNLTPAEMDAEVKGTQKSLLLALVAEPLDKKRIAIHVGSANPDGTVSFAPTGFE